MAQALVTGGGPLAAVVAEVLAASGWTVRQGIEGPAAGDTLVVAVALPEVTHLAALARGLADQLPAPARDATGELRAPGQLVLILDSAAQVPGLGPVDAAVAQAAALRWLPEAALTMAPHLRVNALVCGAGLSAADLTPVLAWLTSAHAVTGQVLSLGPAPRMATPWRGATGGQAPMT